MTDKIEGVLNIVPIKSQGLSDKVLKCPKLRSLPQTAIKNDVCDSNRDYNLDVFLELILYEVHCKTLPINNVSFFEVTDLSNTWVAIPIIPASEEKFFLLETRSALLFMA